MRVPRSGSGLLLLVVGSLLLAVGVGSAFAAIPNPGDGKLYACLTKRTGAVRLINFPKVSTCPRRKKLISWNQTGPQGSQGVQGVAGAEGAAGPAGAQGPAGVTRLTLSHWWHNVTAMGGAGATGTVDVTCPAGKVTGGGFGQTDSNLRITNSYAFDPKTWTVSWRKVEPDPGGLAPEVAVYAVCMTTEPSTVIAKVAGGVKVTKKDKGK